MSDRDLLLAAIYAAPDDDEPRRVYADWLLQQGDKRGEFIQLQLASAKTLDQIKRERALFVSWSDDWLAELGAHPLDAVFERGFVAVAKPRGGAMGPQLLGWATVHTLLEATPRDDVQMPGLRALRRLTDAHVTELAKLVQPITANELEWIRRTGSYASPFPPYQKMTALPKLRRLVLLRGLTEHLTPPSEMRWLWSSPRIELEELVLNAPLNRLRDWLAELTPTRVRSLELRESYDDGWEHHWRCVVRRDDTGRWSHLEAFGGVVCTTSAATYATGFVEAIATLPPRTLTSARISIPKSWAREGWQERIERSFAAQVAPTIEIV